jgi:hypothetical protein
LVLLMLGSDMVVSNVKEFGAQALKDVSTHKSFKAGEEQFWCGASYTLRLTKSHAACQ